MSSATTGNLVYDYFIYPIEAHAGYNVVNTVVYGAIGLVALFLIYKWFHKKGWKFDWHFFKSLIPFIILGSTKRVVTDAVYGGALSGWIYSFYQWNALNVTPGIYITVAVAFFLLYWIEKKKGWSNLAYYGGWALALFHLALLIPAMQFIERAVWIVVLAGIAYLAGKMLLKNEDSSLAVMAQGLDGAATYIAITFYGYGEQHVLTSFLGSQLGYLTFYILKVALSLAILYYVNKESKSEEERNLLTYAIFVMGMAPGLRDVLRLIAGV